VPLAAPEFEPYGGQHVALLVLFVLGAVALVALGRAEASRSAIPEPAEASRSAIRGAQRGGPAGRRTSRVLAVLLCCVAVPGQAYQLTPGDFDLASSLPLQLCDLAWVAAVWALWTRRRLAVALTYYWGLTLTVQGIATPSLEQGLPDPRFFAFWGMHLLVVWSALYLTLGIGLGPRWRDYRGTVTVTAVWAVVVYVLDVVLGVNYGYLVHKPGSASLLDPLGPWPVYLGVGAAVLLAGWALITWPWVRRSLSRPEGAGGGPAHRVAACEARTRSSRSGRPRRR
jgi:hypothetical integral membrane protein (TIGR02206 family)